MLHHQAKCVGFCARGVAAFACVFVAFSCGATWYANGVPSNSDIVMADLRWPYWPNNTYFANWNAHILPEGKVSFYAGYATYCGGGESKELPNLNSDAQQAYHPEWVWSFWGGNTAGLPPTFVDTCEAMHASNSAAGEGAACVMPNRVRVSPAVNTWTTFVTRVWTDPMDGKGRIGRWARDQRTGVWTAIAIASVDQPATGLSGNAGFVETVGNPPMPRTIERKNGFARSAETGVWTATPNFTVTRDAPVALKLFTDEEEEYVALQYAGTPTHLPFGEKMKDAEVTTGSASKQRTIAASQPDKPKQLNEPWMPSGMKVAEDANGFVVVWKNEPHTTPLFAITANKCRKTVANCDETGCVRFKGRVPSSLEVENIFGVCATVKPAIVKPNVLVPAFSAASELESGLDVVLTDPETKAVRTGKIPDLQTLNSLHLGECGEVRGYLKLDEDGFYVFRVRSDGGFVFSLDGKPVLDRSTMHGSTVFSYPVNLARGYHSLSFAFSKEHGMFGHIREINWEGPSFALRPLGRKDVFRKTVAQPRHSAGQAQTFVNGLLMDERIGILPAQPSRLQRLVTADDGSFAVTEDREVHGSPLSLPKGWSWHNLGADAIRYGLVAEGQNGLAFTGQGMHLVSKRVKGDFTMTLKLGERSRDASAFETTTWTGVGAFPVNRGRSWHWSTPWFLVRRVQGDECRTARDFSDYGSTRLSHAVLKPGDWLRISRKGKLHSAWTSENGRDWTLGMVQYLDTAEELDVGCFIMANSGKSTKAQYVAHVSEMKLEHEAVDLPPVKTPSAPLVPSKVVRTFDAAHAAELETKDGVSTLYLVENGVKRPFISRGDCIIYDFLFTDAPNRFVLSTSFGVQHNEGGFFTCVPEPYVSDWWGPVALSQEGKRILARPLCPNKPGAVLYTDNGGWNWTSTLE